MILQVWYLMVMIFSTFPKRWKRKISEVGLTLFVKAIFCEFWCSNLATPLDLACEVANCAASKHTFFWVGDMSLQYQRERFSYVIIIIIIIMINNNNNQYNPHHRHCHHGRRTNTKIVIVYLYICMYTWYRLSSLFSPINPPLRR